MPFWRSEGRIAREADIWVARLNGPEREAHAAESAAWRAADPRNEAAFQRSERLWRDAGRATRTASVVVPGLTRAALERGNRGPRFALAAIVATVTIAGGVYLFEKPAADQLGPHDQLASQATPKTIQLSDGSTVSMGADSMIATNFDGTTRAIALLKGSARFSVAHDPDHPFIVSAGSRTVTARGTVFDVALRPAGLSVTMIEGVVEVSRPLPTGSSGRAVIRLTRGERLIVSGKTERVSAVNTPSSVAVFQDQPPTPIAKIIDEANVGSARPLHLADPTLGREMVEGRFSLSDTVSLARQLAAALDLNLLDDGTSLILSRKTNPKK